MQELAGLNLSGPQRPVPADVVHNGIGMGLRPIRRLSLGRKWGDAEDYAQHSNEAANSAPYTWYFHISLQTKEPRALSEVAKSLRNNTFHVFNSPKGVY